MPNSKPSHDKHLGLQGNTCSMINDIHEKPLAHIMLSGCKETEEHSSDEKALWVNQCGVILAYVSSGEGGLCGENLWPETALCAPMQSE